MSTTTQATDLSLIQQLLNLADELEAGAGHGGHWRASIHAADRIRTLLGEDTPARPSERQVMLTALDTTQALA